MRRSVFGLLGGNPSQKGGVVLKAVFFNGERAEALNTSS